MSPYKADGSSNMAVLEDKFCKDFNCCGLQLNDMHELLQHFEEYHVVIEDEDMDEEDDLQFQFEVTNQDDEGDVDMDGNSASPATSAFTEMYLNKKIMRMHSGSSQMVALTDIYSSDSNAISAFETSVIRRRSISNSQPWLQTLSDSPQIFPIVLEPLIPATMAPQDITRVDPPPTTEIIMPLPVMTPIKPSISVPTIRKDELCDEKDDRPYKCKIAGCNKSYMNPGGLKYHLHHGHCEDTGDPEMNNIIHKPYQCTVPECGKRYKNLNGLKVFYFVVTLVSYRTCPYRSSWRSVSR